MDRVPSSEPYPSPPQPVASSSGGGSGRGIVVAYFLGGILVILAGVLPRAQLLLGSDVVAETKSGLGSGLSIGLVLIGVLMIVRIFTVAGRVQRGGAVVLFIGPLIALFLVVQDMFRVKNVLTDWMLSTGAAQVSSQFNIPIDQVTARINQLIASGDLHVTYKIGIWLGLAGSLLALGAALAAVFMRRQPAAAPVGTGWAPPVATPAGPMATPPAPGSPGAPAAPAATDWTAPPSDWTAPPPSATPPAAAPSAPPTAQPAPAPAAEPAPPPPPATAPEEPESFPPPPPPPPS